MKKIYTLLLVLSSLCVFAQPANDNCVNAIDLPNLDSFCSNNAQYTNVAATASGFASPTCWTGYNNEVWFKFTAIASDVVVSIYGNVSGNGTLARPQVALFSGTCTGTISELGCKAAPAGTNFVTLYRGGLSIGTTYLIRVDAFNANTGTFKLCINNYTPTVAAGQDCSTASYLCNTNTINITNLNGAGTQNQEAAGTCLDSRIFTTDPIESNSVWYTWTAGNSGTLTFDIIPSNPADDLDFVVFQYTGAFCGAKTAIRCSAASCLNAQGSTGLSAPATDNTEVAGCTPAPPTPAFVAQLNMVAGTRYGLLINNFSSANEGFTLSFGGTGTFLGPVANFTSSPATTACVGSTVTFTDSSTGASTYAWNFGSGATPATANTVGPHTVTYATPGVKTITLTIVGSTGCQVVYSQTITVNPNITPSFTTPPAFCSGGTAPVLPTSSNDSPAITGTWSPAVSNTATGTYTFTPTAGQCATTTTLTVTVTPNVTPTFTTPAPICSGGTAPTLPTSSNNTPPITGTWTGPVSNTATGTYTFTPTAGQCATTQTIIVTVTPQVTPTFTTPPPICSG
ncbi:MAG: PKD domain-containing protein, partial [Bacteroidota bacterium]